ncbi:hypothetical protein CEUSTIGMA_g12765.t1 [Chlamydomonas eustigma]|uniref:Uncharacterized protein n=1 Tax=Chlamydomonas eustigma TaxID=1157962 RepID=A0A250XQL1_9CHLO|nr:hypothetical protein CEUSTIGMA_g12765.t1 [Chlamydomonas eustigma]|eukprot:GAX85348.1 hypothetical protein CEUSTIGMA_g12765.t1 [Chlamydomonas eustigma]
MMGAANVDLPAGATTCSHEETRACGASASSGLDRLAALACEYFLPEQEKLSSTSSRQQASSNSALSSGPSTSRAAGQRSADLESCDRADLNSGCRHDFKHKGSKRTRVSSEGVKEELLLSSIGPVGSMYEGGGEPGADTRASENCTPGSSSMDKEEPGIPSNLHSGPHSLVSIHEHLFHPDAQDLHQQELHHEATVDVSPKDFVSQQQERIRVIEAELVRTHQQTQLAEERTRCLEAKNQELGTRLARQEEVNLDQRRMNNMLEARLSELENQLKGKQESMLKGLEEGVKKLLSEYLDRNSYDLDSTMGGFPEPLARDRSNVKDSSSF